MRIAQCLACLGRKTLVSLGNMQKTCTYCKGVGHLEEPDKDLKVTLKDVMDMPKRGRKKRINNEINNKISNEPVLQC